MKVRHRPLQRCHEYPKSSYPRQTGYDSAHIPWDGSGQLAVTEIGMQKMWVVVGRNIVGWW